MAVRLQDIATDLNLSKMTISKVLRGQTDVSAATKARVLKRMKELNYRPNLSAQSLRTGNTLGIGLVIPSLFDPFFAEVASGLVQATRAAGYSVSISTADEDPETERREIELQLSRQVDALVVASVQESGEFFASLGVQKAPLVFIGRKPALIESQAVGLREDEVGYLAATHLIGLGCGRIAYLRGPRTVAADRAWAGYRAALQDAKIVFRADLVIEWSESARSQYARGYDAMMKLLAARPRPDGVMTANDTLAVGAIDAALEQNIRIPREIAIAGCGNAPQSCALRIPLTSVDLMGLEVGQKAGRLLLRALSAEGVAPARNLLVSPRIVPRQSTQG